MAELFQMAELIELAQNQIPEDIYIIEILKNHPIQAWKPAAYVRFVNSTNANQPGAEWQFKECAVIEHEREGTIVIDILKDNRIGGIEFIHLIEDFYDK